MNILKNRYVYLFVLLASALFLRFFLVNLLNDNNSSFIRIISLSLILAIGITFSLRGTAKIIEETTGVLSKKTGVAGGVLQSLGTAFPDMVLGIVAAIISLQLKSTDYAAAINFAIIAAATTFGSNIYNIGHAAWCIFRQNIANKLDKNIFMLPKIGIAGIVKPFREHKLVPEIVEIDTAIDILNALTILTAVVAISMVLFGQVKINPLDTTSDLYQLIRPVGIVIFIICLLIIYHFRKSSRNTASAEEITEEKYYQDQPLFVIWFNLLLAGVIILLSAESMVHAIQVFSEITGLPSVVSGTLAGIIGCLGEIMVVHNFTINPNGRIGDAIVGVAMDNIVTTMGASIVAIMGGIFLGGNALILIFVIILTLNTVLIWQISKLKNFFLQKST